MTGVRAWECDECRVLVRADAVGWIILHQAGDDLHFCPAHAESRQRTGRSSEPSGRPIPAGAAMPGTLASAGQRPSTSRPGAASNADAVTVVQLSFFCGMQEPGGQTRLMVEQKAATIPRSEAGSLVTLGEMSRQAHQSHKAWDDFVDATAEYVATRVDNSAFNPVKDCWESRDPLTPIAVNDALGRFQESLLNLAGKPIEYVAAQAGAGPSGAAIAAGIGANDVLAPVSGLIQRISLVIDTAGMVFGAVTGMYPLAIACAHHLAGIAFHQAVSREVTNAIDGLVPVRGIKREGPAALPESALASRGQPTRLDRTNRPRGVDGPGGGFGVR